MRLLFFLFDVFSNKLVSFRGYNIPNFPQNPKTPAEEDAAARYAKVLGSAVNPVIREGNSDRRVAAPVKRNAQRSKPPVRMREWSKDSKTTVAHMKQGDFYSTEKSATMEKATSVSIEFVAADGTKKVHKKELKLKVKCCSFALFFVNSWLCVAKKKGRRSD